MSDATYGAGAHPYIENTRAVILTWAICTTDVCIIAITIVKWYHGTQSDATDGTVQYFLSYHGTVVPVPFVVIPGYQTSKIP